MLAHQSCADCHGEAGFGDGPGAERLNPAPANWHSQEFQAQSDSCISWKVRTGRGAMPAAARMPEPELADIIAYLRSLTAQ